MAVQLGTQLGETRVVESVGSGAEVRRTVLPCGLRVVTEHVPSMRSAAVGVWVGVGSRDESARQHGAAHYLEHLLFKGTARRGATEIAEQLDAVGGELNAFTSKEHTCYYAHVLDEDLALAVDVLCDVVFDPLCSDADVDLERAVVLEEIAVRDDDPEDLLYETFTATMFGEHPLGRSVLGSRESIEAMTGARLRAFHGAEYQLSNTVISVAGNVRHERVVELLNDSLGPRTRLEAWPENPRAGTADLHMRQRLTVRHDDTEQAHLLLGVPALDRHDERRYALAVLSAALGGGMSSRLFQQVREQRGLAYSVYSATAAYADAGTLSIYAGCHPDRLADVGDVIGEILREVIKHGFSEDEVHRGRGQLRGGLVLGLEDAGSRMSRIAKNELNYGQHFTVDDTLCRIEAVTSEDVNALATTLLRGARHASIVGPYADEHDIPPQLSEVLEE